MSGSSNISIIAWRIKRLPFVGYVCMLAICLLAIAFFDFYRFNLYALERLVWIMAPFLLLFHPFVLSMRLRDAGRSPLWPLLILLPMLYLAWQLMGSLASVSGAPGGGSDPVPGNSVRVENIFLYTTPILLLLLTTFGVFTPSKVLLNPHEVPS